MALFSVNKHRLDPYKNFKFRLKWDGKYVAAADKVSHLENSSAIVKHHPGGDPGSGKASYGRNEFEAIILERGITYDADFQQWANNTGDATRINLILEVYDKNGAQIHAYKIHQCWISEFEATPDLNADLNALAIQHIKLENQGWEHEVDAES